MLPRAWGEGLGIRLKHPAAAEICARSCVDARTLLLEGPEGPSVTLLPARAFGLNKRSDFPYCVGTQFFRPNHFACELLRI